MTFARFPRTEQTTVGNLTMPMYIHFIREVNGVRPNTFGAPVENRDDTPSPGYFTEHYPEARVIHGLGDDGIRVIADSPEAAEAFRTTAKALGIHLNDSTLSEERSAS